MKYIKESYIIIILFVASFVLQIPLLNYIQDDTYIYLTTGRNLAEGNGYSFIPDKPAWGSTSVLPAFLSGFFYIVFPHRAIWCMKLLSSILTSFSVVVIYLLSRKIINNKKVSLVISIFWLFNPWLIRYGFSGMETSMLSVFLLTSLLALKRNKYMASIIIGFGTLIRPELWLLIPLLFIFSSNKKDLVYPIISLLILLPWNMYSLINFGSLLPPASQSIWFHLATQNILFFGEEFFVLFPFFFLSLKYFKNQEDTIFIWWIILVIAFYSFFGSGSPRYLVTLTPLFLVYSITILYKIVKNVWVKNSMLITFFAKCIIVLFFVYSFYGMYSNEFEKNHIETAYFIKYKTPKNSLIYVDGLPGAIQYLSRRNTTGIHPCFPDSYDFKESEINYIKMKKPDYMYIPEEKYSDIIKNLSKNLTKIKSEKYTTFSIINRNVTFALYKINW